MVGEHGPIRWSWASRDGNNLVAYQTLRGRVTLAELRAHLREVAPHATDDDVTVNYATVKWTRPATADELAERESQRAAADERRAVWERRIMREFIERYGPDASRWPTEETT